MPKHRRKPEVDEVILRYIATRRVGRVGMYLSLVISGMISMSYPSLLISTQVGRGTVLLMSFVTIVTAALCALGSITGRWLAEYAVLPFLAIDLFVFGVAALIAADQQQAFPLAAYGFLVIALSLGLQARWEDVRAISKVRTAEAKVGESSKE